MTKSLIYLYSENYCDKILTKKVENKEKLCNNVNNITNLFQSNFLIIFSLIIYKLQLFLK